MARAEGHPRGEWYRPVVRCRRPGAGASRQVGADPDGDGVRGGADRGRRGGAVGSAAGPVERGRRGGPAGTAPDRPGRVFRRGVLPGAGRALLAGGDFLSDRALLADPATAALRGGHALPSVATLWRFLAGADLGRVTKAAATNRVMLRRAWAAGAAPEGTRLTIDPDATRVATYGPGKQGSAFARTGQPALSPLVGVCGETGDVLAIRARGGAANDGRAMGSFLDECVRAVPSPARKRYRLWIRGDSAGYSDQVLAAAERHDADFSVTARGYSTVTGVVHAGHRPGHGGDAGAGRGDR